MTNDQKPRLARGAQFQHDRMLDEPEPGQRYSDAQKSMMAVSRVTATTVYFRGVDGRGSWRLGRQEFLTRFGDQFTIDAPAS